MSIKTSIANTLRRLNVHGRIMALPIYGQALYDAIAEEFDLLNDFRNQVSSAVVPNVNMDSDTIEDFESKYGIANISTSSDKTRIERIIERASGNGNGGADWFEERIQAAGFDLYVHVNEQNVTESPSFNDYQFNEVQFGDLVTYTDPRDIPGEIIASSPIDNIGGLFEQFGTEYQFDDLQFGTIDETAAYPRPKTFSIPSDPDRWGYVFFLSPSADEVVTDELDMLALTEEEYSFLHKLILQTKFTRNWCIAQVSTATIQEETTDDGLVKMTDDGLYSVVISDIDD